MLRRPRTGPVHSSRASYVRTGGRSILVNDPAGFPSSYGPVPWGSVTSGGELPPVYWLGLDSGAGAYPIGPNGPGGAGRGVSAVIRATSLIVDPIASSPWRVMETGTEGWAQAGTPLATPRWLSDPMLLRPDARYGGLGGAGGAVFPAVNRLPRGLFWRTWLQAALWGGMGGLLFVEDGQGQPQAGSLRVVHPGMLDTHRVPEADGGYLVWRLGDSDEHVDLDRDGRLEVGGLTWRLTVLRNPHSPVDTEGRSKGVFELSSDVFGLAEQMSTYARGTFRSGIPAGYLRSTVPGLTQAQADEMKTRWLAAHGGDRRSIAVLTSTTEFVPLTMSPVDTALVEMKTSLLTDVAHAFGIDAVLLGGSSGESMTYSNSGQRWTEHRIGALSSWLSGVQDTHSALLPGTQGVEVDLDSLLRADTKTRYEAHEVALRSGWKTVDEVRAEEGLPPLSPEPEPALPEGAPA